MKILLILDLDYTHFIYHQPGVVWIGGKTKRLQFYLDLIQKAKQQNVEVICAVVSSKTGYDDLCREAAKEFKEFLQNMNPHMYTTINELDYLLIKLKGQLVYQCVTHLMTAPVDNSNEKHSHFHLVYPASDKITAMLEIGRAHDIPVDRTIFLDDDLVLLNSAKEQGINTVSFNCFSPVNPDRVAYHDEAEILRQLDAIHEQINQTFDACLLKCEEAAKQKEEPEAKRTKLGN